MFGAMARRLDDTMAVARAQAAEMDRAADELVGLVGRARSPRGDAEAVVDAHGALVSLHLAASVARLPVAVVGALIVDTAHAAAMDAAQRRRRVLEDLALDRDG